MIERWKITSREEWLQRRKADVTASVVGALFGVHPYCTELRLFAEKRGVEFVVEDSSVMRRGRWMEPAVAKAVMETRPGWKLIPANEYLRDVDLRLGASPDFYIEGDPRGLGICQTKTVSLSVYERDWAGGIEPPLWVSLQTSVEGMLADAAFIAIAALIVDPYAMELSLHESPRSFGAEEKIKTAVREFWQRVETGEEPAPDYARDSDVIRAMWRREAKPEIEIDLSGDNFIRELLTERCALKETLKTIETRVETIDSQLRYTMKDAAVATGIDGFRLSYKTSHFKGYTVPESDRRILRVTTDQREKN